MKKKSKTYKIHYYDETGRRRGKTFSAPTLTEAKLKAEEWKDARVGNKRPSMTVLDAVTGYIDLKSAVLSPATVRGYNSIRDNDLGDLRHLDAAALSKADLQGWISGLAASKKPKSVRNAWGLLRSSLDLYDLPVPAGITLPRQPRKDVYCPGDDDIAALLAHIRRKGDKDLLRAVYLAAFIPARRSEICALQKQDIKGNAITISKAMVMQPGGGWIIKQPKVADSYRTVTLPAFVIKELQAAPDRLVSYQPNQLSNVWRRTIEEAGMRPFRLHDLRHYGASIMMYQGISQRTIEQRGGWAPGSPVLRKIYQNRIDEEQRKENKKVISHFSRFK